MAHPIEDTSGAQHTSAEHQSINNDENHNALVINSPFNRFMGLPKEVRFIVWDFAVIANLQNFPRIHTMASQLSASPYTHIVPTPHANRTAKAYSRNLRLVNTEVRDHIDGNGHRRAVYEEWPSVTERTNRDFLGNILRIQYNPNPERALVNLRYDIFYPGDRRLDPSGFYGQFNHVRRLALPWRTWFDNVSDCAKFVKWLEIFPSLQELSLIIDLWKIMDMHLEPREISPQLGFVPIPPNTPLAEPAGTIMRWAMELLNYYSPGSPQFVIPNVKVMCLPFDGGVVIRQTEKVVAAMLAAELSDASNSWIFETDWFNSSLLW